MPNSIVRYLGSQPIMQIIRGLLSSPKPRHIRDLAAHYAISPSGVSDIIRRLRRAGVLREQRIGNRRCVCLALNAEERECMLRFFTIFENSLLEKRAVRFSKRAAQKLEWMDETFKFYRDLKGAVNDPS